MLRQAQHGVETKTAQNGFRYGLPGLRFDMLSAALNRFALQL
jgi:hypothetical protein